MPQSNAFVHSTSTHPAGSSYASSHTTAFVDSTGAGVRSTSTSTSPTGETSTSEEEIFTPGASSSGGQAIAITSPTTPYTSVVVEAPVSSDTNLIHPTLPTNPLQPSPGSSIRKRVRGNFKNNRLHGSYNNDMIHGRGGHDRLKGRYGDDHLRGGSGHDTLEGGDGNDLLIGGTGKDVLNGGVGADTLIGGARADSFVLDDSTLDATTADIIVDFRATQGDKFILQADVSIDAIRFEVFDFDSSGSIDSTLIRLSTDNSILGIVLGTVNVAGETTLTTDNFVYPGA